MPTDDPFFNSKSDDRTVIRPVPGGRKADIQRPPPQATAPPPPSISEAPLPRLGRLNPLERCASGLLALLAQLNNSRNHSDPNGLKNKIVGEIKRFQSDAIASNIDQETVFAARYVLCTALDETVLNTPWGTNSGWSQQSLLSSFHKEVSGGDRFFQLLKSFGENPSKNIYLLELMHLLLALGFQGRYRIAQNGKEKLIDIKEWLYQLIRKERGHKDQALSPHWQGVSDQRSPLMRYVPTWVFGTAGIALLAILFSILLFHLNSKSDPVFKQVFSIRTPVIEIPEPPPAPPILPPPVITLSTLLAEEISQNLVQVEEMTQQSRATIQGDNLFSSGKSIVNQQIIPLLNRIGESLNLLEGQVLITGHTDNDAISTARYPSNWHLSLARAEAVAEIIKQDLDQSDRIVIEGRADLEPVALNDTKQGKAKNRRVEILLIK
ncbi:MAG: type VI secretion system protein TssL [Sedimenticola sp.]|nr:MAG: type VI secretion system protein TssL [Sedimenticola sp.]